LAKFYVSCRGFTLSTLPPVASEILLRVSILHSSPSIDTMFTVTPLFFANSPIYS
jgi:hypothetical protein